MAAPSSDIGRTITVDYSRRPGLKGKVIGYLIELERELPGVDAAGYQGSPTKYIVASNEEVSKLIDRERYKYSGGIIGKITAMAGGRRRRNRTRRNRRN